MADGSPRVSVGVGRACWRLSTAREELSSALDSVASAAAGHTLVSTSVSVFVLSAGGPPPLWDTVFDVPAPSPAI